MAAISRVEQREQTRQTLLDATMECLFEYGYAGTTTQRIQDRAGVSRGALSHHFASKTELLVEATQHIASLRLVHLEEVVKDLDSAADPLPELLAVIREAMSGPPFQAALELWSASRTDPQLREALLPAERKLGAAVRGHFLEHAGIADRDAANLAFESLMALVRGLELTRLVRPDDRLADKVLENWLDSVQHLRD